jgi:hypothetical protein
MAWRRIKKRSLVLSVVSLGLASLLTGCGGSGTSGDTVTAGPVRRGTAVPTRAEFVKTANAICAKAEAERGRAIKASPLEPLKKQISAAQLNEVILESALPPIRGMVEDISKLTPPAGEGQQVAEIVKSLEAAVRRSEKKPQDAVSGAAFVQADKKIKAYGLSISCSI